MYDYEVIVNYIGITPYLLTICLSTSIFNLWPSGLNNVAPVFLMSIPANNNYHVEQSWTENLESLNCSFNFTSSYVNGTYSYAEKDAHWFGVPYISSNDTVGIEYEFDTCNGRLENDTDVNNRMNDLLSQNHTDCDFLHDAVNTILSDSATAGESQIGHGYWWGEHKNMMTKTVSTEFELVCDRDFYIKLSTSLYYAGYAVGAIVFGNMSDLKGRKYVMRITAVMALISDMVIVFSTNYWIFLGGRIAVAMFLSGCYVATFTYAMEILPQRLRSFAGVNVQAQFAVGYIILGFLTGIPILHDWHYFSAAIACFTGLGCLASFYVPESPAWLFSQGRTEEALSICDDIHYRKNGEATLPDHIIETSEILTTSNEKVEQKTERSYTMMDLFKNKEMTIITFIIMFQWLVNTMTYYGLTFGAGDLPGSVILNNTIGGVMEIGSQLLLILLMDRAWCGRKKCLIGLEFLASITCLACAVMYHPDMQTMLLELMSAETLQMSIQICAMVGKFGIAGSFSLIYNYTAELYPIVVRANGVAIGSVSGRIGGIIFPFVLDMGSSIGTFFPMALFGGLCLICTFTAFYFPETRNSPTLTTIDDAQAFYKGDLKNTKETF